MKEKIQEQNSRLISQFGPLNVWRHFLTLTQTDRETTCEGSMADAIEELAANYPRAVVTHDKYHNVMISISASHGFEHYPPICIQSNIDMVIAADDNRATIFPIELRLQGKKLSANGTTLGASGIGAAAMMSFIVNDFKITHGPLELLFTTQKESGMAGAKNFNYKWIKSRKILTLCAKEEGILYVNPLSCVEPQNALTAKAVHSYKQLYNTDATIKLIHPGLESSVFLEHLPDAEIVCFGPSIGAAGTTKEWLDTDSVSRFLTLLGLLISI